MFDIEVMTELQIINLSAQIACSGILRGRENNAVYFYHFGCDYINEYTGV